MSAPPIHTKLKILSAGVPVCNRSLVGIGQRTSGSFVSLLIKQSKNANRGASELL